MTELPNMPDAAKWRLARTDAGSVESPADLPAELPNLLDAARWRLARTDAGSIESPADLPAELQWRTAQVPGTVASVLGAEDAGAVDEYDWWLLTDVPTGGERDLILTFGGIATHAEIWVDGVHRATTTSMFVPESIELLGAGSTVSVAVHVRSLSQALKGRRPRGRWRSSLIAQQGLRHERTTMLGRAPVYGPLPIPVGLWRPVTLTPRPSTRNVQLSTVVDGDVGKLRVRAQFEIEPTETVVSIDGRTLAVPSARELDVEIAAPGVELWWPHTHGTPRTYPVTVVVDGVSHHVGVVGFRTVRFERAGGAAELIVNGERVFCRGATWTPLDPVRLWSNVDQLRSVLGRVAGAGLNMVRVVGTMVYEQSEFWSLCSELGIMVWQDVMLGTVDPPTDDTYTAMVRRELQGLLREVAGNPALVVLSGGSETQQQPTMLGLAADEQRMVMLDSVVPEFVEQSLPTTAYVTSSPSSASGELHTHVGDGVAHYFGVGGYLRPLSDIRTAAVRFAAECLAFAVPPERSSVDAFFGSAAVAGHHPDWKAAVPRDRGSSWDFEDVRDHYVRELFDVDPHSIRRDDAELYLDYGRAAVAEAVSAAFGHWRRESSGCGGALILTLRDTVPGAGWGITDSAGVPKAPWYALARASKPVALLLSDNGLDGYSLALVNDGPAFTGVVRVVLHGASGGVSTQADTAVDAAARSSTEWSVDSIIGTFTDANHAYRFGTRTYSAITVFLLDDNGVEVTRTTTLIGAQPRQNSVGLRAALAEREHGNWELTVESEWPAQYVCVDVDGFDVSDSWFHLAANEPRTVTLTGSGTAKPRGHVRALNSTKRAPIAP